MQHRLRQKAKRHYLSDDEPNVSDRSSDGNDRLLPNCFVKFGRRYNGESTRRNNVEVDR